MGSSYEVYIDVRHHPRHNEDWERRESTAFKFGDVPDQDELVYVVNGLRAFADQLDPRFICSVCGKTRGEHHREGGMYRCFNRLGPYTMHKSWQAPND